MKAGTIFEAGGYVWQVESVELESQRIPSRRVVGPRGDSRTICGDYRQFATLRVVGYPQIQPDPVAIEERKALPASVILLGNGEASEGSAK